VTVCSYIYAFLLEPIHHIWKHKLPGRLRLRDTNLGMPRVLSRLKYLSFCFLSLVSTNLLDRASAVSLAVDVVRRLSDTVRKK